MQRRDLMTTAGLLGVAGLTGWLGTPRQAMAAPTTTAGRAPQWTTAPVTGRSSFLNAVDSTADGTWTVGSLLLDGFSQTAPFIARWQGGRWRTTAQPLRTNATLQAVAVAGPTDVWALGVEHPDEFGSVPVVLRWNGTAWRRVATPLTTGDFSQAVVAADGSVWIGGWGEVDGVERAVVYRIQRGRWTLLGAGLEQTINVNALLVLGPRDVWAALNPGLAHFDGRKWTPATEFPSDGATILTGLAADPAGRLWASGLDRTTSGGDGLPAERPLVLRFSGKTWSRVATPNRSAQLYDIAASADGPVAVGEKFEAKGDTILNRPYVLRLGSSGFVESAAPTKGEGTLTAIDAGTQRLWTVGATVDADAGFLALAASAPLKASA